MPLDCLVYLRAHFFISLEVLCLHRIVFKCFMTILYAVLFVVVWSVGFYLLKAYALNSRIENIMVSMQADVSKNNYLSPESYVMYERMLMDLQDDMNTGGDVFIDGFVINYNHDCTTVPPANGLTYSTRLDTVADMGDVAIIELQVYFRTVDLFFDPGASSGADRVGVNNDTDVVFSYVYQVPCLRYINVTE